MKLKSFKNWKILNKIVSISVVSILLLFAFSIGILLPFVEKKLMNEKISDLNNLTDMVHNLFKEYDERVKKGEFNLEEAQKRAKERTRNMRYGRDEYIFIINTDVVIVMHPTMPQLEGKSGAETRDSSGKLLFVEMTKIVKENGEGSLSYLWPKPGQAAQSQKQAYVKLYKPWGWIIGTGSYLDDVNKGINLIRNGIILSLLVCSSIILILAWNVAKIICQPLFEAIEVSKRLAIGDLTGTIEPRSSDETGQLMLAMQQMIAGLRDYHNKLELLHEYQARLAAIIEYSEDGIIAKDLDGNINAWNHGAEKIFGYSAEEVIGHSILMLIPQELLPEEVCLLDKLKSGGCIDHFETVRLAKGERQIEVSVTVSPIRDKDGNVIGASKVVRDITERKQLEKERQELANQLQKSQKLESLGVLAGGIAHDFNNILAIIIGHCFLAKNNSDNAENSLNKIEKAAGRAADLCRQMLAYAGKAQFVQADVNIAKLVTETVKIFKPTIPPNVAIKLDCSPDIPFMKTDTSQISQIVMNLITNAAESINDAQGEVRVSLTKKIFKAGHSEKDYYGKNIPPGLYACLEVSDDGCGMSDETYNRAFEPFYTTKFTGRGLGLSAVLGIVTAQGGALELFSQPDEGTTLKVYLPLQVSDSSAGETLELSEQSDQ